MKIGDLRHRITFQEKVEVPDGYKGQVVTWQPVIVLWASVEPLSGREYFYGHQIKAEVTHRVKIRYNEKITTEMRIEFRSRHLAIESIIDPEERHALLEIFAREEK